MHKLLNNIIRSGISHRNGKAKNREIFLTNSITLITILMIVLLMIVHFTTHQDEQSTFVLFVAILIQLFIPLLNKRGHTILARTLLSFSIVTVVFLVTILRKMEVSYESSFYVSRCAILIVAVLFPFTLFHYKEKVPLYLNLLFGFLVTFLFDPIHNLLGIGYYQKGFTAPDYYYNNFFFLVIYCLLAITLGYLKYILERYEVKYEKSIQQLDHKNRQIKSQKEELVSANYLMEKLLSEKDKNLMKINQELIKQNLELLQFSHTVSHNLRGPVARMLGLINLSRYDNSGEEARNINKYLFDSIHEMDAIVRELNQILNIREDKFDRKEEVFFTEELFRIRKHLASTCPTKVEIVEDIQTQSIFSVRSYLYSIMENLIVNAIQFRTQDRVPEVTIRTYSNNGTLLLEVIDNGMGIDLNNYESDLFKPFKTFHRNASGKGLGLYLTKLKVEKLGGYITVDSVVGKGSKFKLYLHN